MGENAQSCMHARAGRGHRDGWIINDDAPRHRLRSNSSALPCCCGEGRYDVRNLPYDRGRSGRSEYAASLLLFILFSLHVMTCALAPPHQPSHLPTNTQQHHCSAVRLSRCHTSLLFPWSSPSGRPFPAQKRSKRASANGLCPAMDGKTSKTREQSRKVCSIHMPS